VIEPLPTNAAAASPRPFTAGAFRLRMIAGLTILLTWELVVRGFAPAYVAKPSGIARAFPDVIVDPAFLAATGQTLLAVAEGLLIALAIGTVIGLVTGRSPLLERALRYYINGFYAVPMIVVLPLVSLWFGYTGAARLATIVFAALFSIIINVADGAKAVPQDYLEVARSFRSGRLRAMFDIVIPSATPYLLAGLRLAAGRALIGAVVAEFFTAIGGLGYFILYQSRTFHHNEAFVGVLLLAGFGVGGELLVNVGIRHLLPWYRRDDRTE
jgi:ABC-type nitrate/sulfonate/bicarbonate transport system permease component